MHEGVTQAQGVTISHAPSKDAAKDIASAGVRWQHAVAYESDGGTHVVSDDLGAYGKWQQL